MSNPISAARPRRILSVALLLFIVCPLAVTAQDAPRVHATNGFQFSTAPAPDWVRSGPLPEAPPDSLESPVSYLLSDRQVRLHGGGVEAYHRVAMRVNSGAGLEEASELHLPFNPEYQSLTIHQVRVIRDGQAMDKLVPDAIKLIQRESDMERRLYDGTVTALAILDDIRVGDVLEYAFSVAGANPVFGGNFVGGFALAWSVPVGQVRIRLQVPAERRLATRVFGVEAAASIDRSKPFHEYIWERNGVPAVIAEGDNPRWYDPYPWLQVSEFADWRSVVDWALPLYATEGSLSPILRSRIRQWKTDLPDTQAQILAALRFVQEDIRYFGIELGENSHRPHLPNQVFERRYGDCKDKTQLLLAILRELGVEAYPALVSSDFGHGIDQWLASPTVFNHVIVTAYVNGQQYWLDGTLTHQRGTLDSLGFPDYGLALVVRPGSNGLVAMKAPPNYERKMTVEEKFEVSHYEQPATLTVRSVYRGRFADQQRYRFATTSRREIADSYLNFYAHRYPGVQPAAVLTLEDDEQSNTVTVVESYRIPELWNRDGARRYAEFFASTIQDFTQLPKVVERRSPLGLNHPVEVRHTTVLQYPEDIEYDLSDEGPVTIEDDALRYRRTAAYGDRQLRIEYNYRSKRDAVMPAALDGHMRRLRQINDDLYYSTWLDSSTVTEDQQAARDRRQNLIDRLLRSLSADRE